MKSSRVKLVSNENCEDDWGWPDQDTCYTDFMTEVILPEVFVDLELQQEVNPTLGLPGDEFTYSFTVTNLGTSTATGVVLTRSLSVPVNLVEIPSPSQGSYDNGTGIWSIGALEPGQSVSMVMVITFDAT